jgi:alkanesulfonate monooxygenase SsuD/methylene tetrahydromethanopterin reductase-like flavin-dependent oxidoreductase (luciferase family)
MEIGAAIFFTDYSMEPPALAVALEERGFDSLWVAEHSHIPVTRRFGPPGGSMELTKQYYDGHCQVEPFRPRRGATGSASCGGGCAAPLRSRI